MGPDQYEVDREQELRNELAEKFGVHAVEQPRGSSDAPDLFGLGIFDEETARLIEELDRKFSNNE